MFFIDGENLLWRFEAMKKASRVPRIEVIHEPGRFVWTSRVTRLQNLEIVRVSYYTSQVGSDDKLRALQSDIQRLRWSVARTKTTGGMVAHVFKKPAKEQKAASVDINITIDLLRTCYHRHAEAVVLISGDGDYIPLVKEAMRTGTHVIVGALSSGVNTALTSAGDSFWNLDSFFFEKETPPPSALVNRSRSERAHTF
jgi:uncharacterized LabA/DUF88 family protein